ncbi:hypothetical protein [Haloquadratum walsbyi]|uniref:hypothetical protein n=1 Tax=Haloquadratum walsbyi TaxID=293091 RepID=UPI0023F14778|nr:hypothetical protein [Haloquadratum walsbyi]
MSSFSESSLPPLLAIMTWNYHWDFRFIRGRSEYPEAIHAGRVSGEKHDDIASVLNQIRENR